MTIRLAPSGPVPVLATDAAYDDPGEAWDLAPTKVALDAGALASGMLPNRPLNADELNWILNQLGVRVGLHELDEVTNWTESATITGTSGNATGIGGACCAPFEAHEKLWFCPKNDENVLVSTDGGYTWAADLTVAGADFKGLANSDVDVVALYLSGANYKIGLYDPTAPGWDTSTTVIAAASGTPLGVVWDPYAAPGSGMAVYYVHGASAGANAQIFKVTTTVGTYPATVEDVSAAGLGQQIRGVACSPDVVLAYDENEVYAYSRTGDFGASIWTNPDGPTAEIAGLVWDAENGWFVLVISDGTAYTTTCYRSTDGTTWDQVGASSPLATSGTGVRSALLLARGGVTLFGAEADPGGVYVLLASPDAGETWNSFPDPMGRFGTGERTTFLAGVGNRILAGTYTGGGAYALALSMRAGPTG